MTKAEKLAAELVAKHGRKRAEQVATKRYMEASFGGLVELLWLDTLKAMVWLDQQQQGGQDAVSGGEEQRAG